MKKILLILPSVILLFVLTLIMLIFGFNLYETEQICEYAIEENLTNEEIAENVMNQYFDYYKTHGFGDRLLDYKINGITLLDNERAYQEHIGEKNGFVFSVGFDLKPLFYDSGWYAGNGTDGENRWIVDKLQFYKIIIEKDKYVLDFIGTMY